jgi:hypothetical protein
VVSGSDNKLKNDALGDCRDDNSQKAKEVKSLNRSDRRVVRTEKKIHQVFL